MKDNLECKANESLKSIHAAKKLYYFCRKYAKEAFVKIGIFDSMAEDIGSEIFLKLWKKKSYILKPGWIKRVVWNEVKMCIRKEKRGLGKVFLRRREPVFYRKKIEAIRVVCILIEKKFSKIERRVLNLLLKGCSITEIEEIIGINRAYMYVVYFRIKRKIEKNKPLYMELLKF